MSVRYEFDTPVNRRGSCSYKWDTPVSTDILPMWVADMDFLVAPAIDDALRRRVDQGILAIPRFLMSIMLH